MDHARAWLRPAASGGRSRGRRLAVALVSVLVGVMLVPGLTSVQHVAAAAPTSPAVRMLVAKTEAEAREAVALYTAGLAFERIIRERSIGPARERGGYLGRIDVASLSPMARSAILNTRPGRLTPVFAAEGGFGVFQVLTEREEQEEEARLRREPDALEALKQAIELGRRGDLEEAVRLLRRAVELNPALVDGYFNLAVAYARLGRLGDAISTMQEVLRLQPQDFDAHLRLGNWLSAQGRHAEAAIHFERAAALDMDSRDAWLGMARSYEAAGRPRAAVAAYRRVLGLVGQDDRALLEALLRVATAAPDGPAAVEAARRLRAFRPGHEGFLTVGEALMLNGETEAATREYRMAVGLAPGSPRAHAGLAMALAGLGQTEPAAEHLLQAIRLEPANPEHYRVLSVLYERAGRLDLAIVALRDGAGVATGAPRETQAELAARLAALYDRAGMHREAEQERVRAKTLGSP